MIASAVLFAVIGTFLFKSSNSAAIDYDEPIKITVNENFNAQPGQVSQGLESLDPSVIRQGANFHFKPQLTLPQGYAPSHIEDTTKIIIKKDKLEEILKPLMHLSSNFTKLPPLSSILPVPILINNELKPVTSEHLVNPESPMLMPLTFNDIPSIIEKVVKQDESNISVTPRQEPIIINAEPKPATTSEFLDIPEAPVLPPLSLNDISSIVKKAVKKEKLITTGVKETTVGPIQKPTVVDAEPQAVTSESVIIPEAPKLPSLSLNDEIPSVVEEEVKKGESIILEEPTGVFPPIPEISVGPKQEPIIINAEHKPVTSKYLVIPEAPTLPPLSYNGIPPVVEEEVKKEEPIILEESTDVFPSNSEISVGPKQEPIIINDEPKPVTSEFSVIPEAPVLPPLSLNDISSLVKKAVKKEKLVTLEESSAMKETSIRPIQKPTIVDAEPQPVTSEFMIIPEAPTLPPLSLNDDILSVFEPEIKKEKSIILEEPADVFPPIPEISVGPIQEPIIIKAEPKPVTSEFLVIPEAPVLPPLSLNDNSSPSLKHLLLKNQPFRLPITPFPKLSQNVIKTLKSENKNQFGPTSYAHNIVEKRIAPNMVFKNSGPKLEKMFTRFDIPKGSS